MKHFIKKINEIGIGLDLSNISKITREEYDRLRNIYLKGDKTKRRINKNEEIQEYTENMYKIFKYQLEDIGTIDMAQKTLGNLFLTLATSNEEIAINDSDKDLIIKYYLISIYLHILSLKNKREKGINTTEKDFIHIKMVISGLIEFIISNYDFINQLDYNIFIEKLIKIYDEFQNNFYEEIKDVIGEQKIEYLNKELYYNGIFRHHQGKRAIQYFHELFDKNKEEFNYITDFVLFNTILNIHKYSFFSSDIINQAGIKKTDLDEFYKRDLKILDYFKKRIVVCDKFSSLYINLSFAIALGHYKRFFEKDNLIVIDNFKKLKDFLYKNSRKIKESEKSMIEKHIIHMGLLIIYLNILEFIKKVDIKKINSTMIEGLFKLIKTKQSENHFESIKKQEKTNNDKRLCDYIWLIYLYTRDTLRYDEIEQLFREFSFVSGNPQRSIVNLYNLTMIKHFNRRLNMIKNYDTLDEKTLNKVFISLLKQEETDFTKKTVEELEIIELLNKYESNKIEFKSSFCVNVHNLIQLKNKNITGDEKFFGPYLKTIVAFLNSGGGELIVGVREEKSLEQFRSKEKEKGHILGDQDINFSILETKDDIPGKYLLGLEYDMKFKNIDEEGIQKIFDQTVHKNIDPNPVSLGIIIECKILDFFGKKIAKITVPSSKEPVYLKTKEGDVFYIRQNGQSIPIESRQMAEYQRKYFSN